jgi:hypothetical protein
LEHVFEEVLGLVEANAMPTEKLIGVDIEELKFK